MWAIWKSALYGRISAVLKSVGCVDWGGLCGIAWAIRDRVGYMEEFRLCGIMLAIWKSVGCVK